MFIFLKNDDGLVYKGVLTFLLFSKVLKFCGALKQTNGKNGFCQMACENIVYSNSLRLIISAQVMFWKNSKFFVEDIDEDTDGVDASF